MNSSCLHGVEIWGAGRFARGHRLEDQPARSATGSCKDFGVLWRDSHHLHALQCQKRPTTTSNETHYSVKEHLAHVLLAVAKGYVDGM